MSIEENLKIVRDQIEEAGLRRLHASGPVQLVAVSKTYDRETVQIAINAGQRVFGENRVQEAKDKWPDLKGKTPDIELHLIGPLQSNKVKDAIMLFDVIETIDRRKIACAIAKESKRLNKYPNLFVQVNTGLEAQKAGIEPQEAVAFVKFCQDELSLPIIGLMCIPPNGENPGPHFALLQKLSQESGLEQLSMGMSQDYQTAIAFGASYVRVGSAIFGHRS